MLSTIGKCFTKADAELTDLIKFTLLLLNENLCIFFAFVCVVLFVCFKMHLGTVAEHIERIYRRAGSKKLWFVYMCHVPFVLH